MFTLTVLYSKHAREQMINRGISSQEVEAAIVRGSKGLQSPDKILAYYKYFCVVYKRVDEDDFVITVKPR